MTKKDFELIAAVLNVLELPRHTKDYLAATFREALAQNNPKFDAARFIKACQKRNINAQDTEL